MNHYKEIQDFTVIVGVDANHFIKDPKINESIEIIPTDPSEATTIKKRSYIQAQYHKADQQVNEVKDHIITTMKIE